MRTKNQISLKLSMMALAFCCFGCSGGGTDVDLGKVSGVVTVDGNPITDAIVVFSPEKGNPSTGRTDASGNYELSYLGDAMGAIIGNHKVSIKTGKPVVAATDGEADLSNASIAAEGDIEDATAGGTKRKRKPKKGEKDPIPAKYNAETKLTADVKAGSNTFDFKLESK